MAGTLHTPAHARLVVGLIEARRAAGLSQAGLGARVGRPPSFVGKYETGERRLDAVEVLVILRALEQDPAVFLTRLLPDLPDRLG